MRVEAEARCIDCDSYLCDRYDKCKPCEREKRADVSKGEGRSRGEAY